MWRMYAVAGTEANMKEQEKKDRTLSVRLDS